MVLSGGVPLTAITNAAVEFHRENFGRGPGAARSHVTDDLIVCVLTDVFTPLEQRLLEGGDVELVRTIRSRVGQAPEEALKEKISSASGRRVLAHLNTVRIETAVSIDVFLLEPQPSSRPPVRAARTYPEQDDERNQHERQDPQLG